jgi:hypothetical protein
MGIHYVNLGLVGMVSGPGAPGALIYSLIGLKHGAWLVSSNRGNAVHLAGVSRHAHPIGRPGTSVRWTLPTFGIPAAFFELHVWVLAGNPTGDVDLEQQRKLRRTMMAS